MLKGSQGIGRLVGLIWGLPQATQTGCLQGWPHLSPILDGFVSIMWTSFRLPFKKQEQTTYSKQKPSGLWLPKVALLTDSKPQAICPEQSQGEKCER